MDYIFSLTENYRSQFKGFLEQYSLDELNTIPKGFNNNIIWHIGHIIATYDILCYKLCGLPLQMSEEFVEKYKKGTKPESFIEATEIEFIKEQLSAQILQSKLDYDAHKFGRCTPYTTSFGNELTSIEDILKFDLVHEGLHLGMILAMRKLIEKK